MGSTAYLVDPDPDERKQIQTILSPSVEVVHGLDSSSASFRDEVYQGLRERYPG